MKVLPTELIILDVGLRYEVNVASVIVIFTAEVVCKSTFFKPYIFIMA